MHGIRGRFEISVCTLPFALKARVGVWYLQLCHKQTHCISFLAKRQFEQRSELGLWIRCTKVCVASQDAEPQRVIWITLSFFPGRTAEANGQRRGHMESETKEQKCYAGLKRQSQTLINRWCIVVELKYGFNVGTGPVSLKVAARIEYPIQLTPQMNPGFKFFVLLWPRA